MTRRQKAAAFFVGLCVVLVAAAISLNVSWIVINARRVAPLVLGVVLFALIIAGLIVYTVFLVLELRRNEEHDSFINAVTHELKTPIASIRLYLETLKTRSVDDAQRQQFYDVMLADAERLHHTVEQVLKAGAARERRKGTTRVPVSLAHLAAECVELARVRHHLRPDAITFEAHGEDTTVQASADDLRIAITNLVDNAVKFSPDGVQVAVSVAAASRETAWVRVQDHGIGIPKRHLKRVFTRFYRVQMRTQKPVKGTGLGLYLVRTIARSHGGRVFAHSEGEGRGATFTFELPRVKPA